MQSHQLSSLVCPCLSGTAALEEDAQILKVIEAYCTSAKTRQTLNSSEYAHIHQPTYVNASCIELHSCCVLLETIVCFLLLALTVFSLFSFYVLPHFLCFPHAPIIVLTLNIHIVLLGFINIIHLFC